MLDAGCGVGQNLISLAPLFDELTGVDFSDGMLHEAQIAIKNGPKNINLINSELSAIPVKDKAFNNILCTRVLSLNRYPELILQELGRVCSYDGNLLLTDVHPSHPYENTRIYDDKQEYFLETHKHPLEKIKGLLVRAGFKDINLTEFALGDLLPQPDHDNFKKLYSAGNPKIFYVISAKHD